MQVIRRLIQRVAAGIAPDLEAANGGPVDMETMVDVVLDCDRLESEVIRNVGDRAIIRKFRLLPISEQDSIARDVL